MLNNNFFAPRSAAASTLLSFTFTFHTTSALFRTNSVESASIVSSHAAIDPILFKLDPVKS